MPNLLHRAIVAASAAALAACGQGREAAPPAAAAPNVVTVTAVNYAFTLPDTIPPGVTTVRVVNGGTEIHHIQIIQLLEGRTLDSLLAALHGPGSLPAWAVMIGGPNAVVPGDTAAATLDLPAGHYALVCFVPGPDGAPHFTKGMARELEVAGTPGTATEPVADRTMHLSDYAFALDTPLTAGTHVIRVVNDGPQPHEAVLVQLAPGRTIGDVMTWVDGGMHGAPPGKPIGGVTGLTPGRHVSLRVALTPGNYGWICFFTSPDGKEHAQHGMLTQFTVS